MTTMRAALLCLTLVLGSLTSLAQALPEIRHTLRFPDAKNHYVHVESVYPTNGAAELEVFMAVWTPGSYLVREYARNLDYVEASSESGAKLKIAKSRKNRWIVETNGARTVSLRYPIYSREMSVRTNFVDASFAMIQGAATFLSPVGKNNLPHQVTVELPATWKQALSGLDVVSDTGQFVFRAADYDTLVDCPIIAGNPDVFEFEVEGKRHFLVNTPASPHWDGAKSVDGVRKVVEHYARMWGGLPYDRYLFFNMLVDAGGGLEHKNSTVIMADTLTMMNENTYLGNGLSQPPRGGWLDLVSHEFFHVWNVKRLRPVELGPFDYENENYSPSLWVSEGFTSYYSALALRRADLITQEDYLARLSGLIATLQTKPGRLVQPVADSSYDAWVKGYRPDENSPNSTISYYTKGAVLGFLLDARLRKATQNAKSLDDVMRLAYGRYSGESGYTQGQFIACVGEVGGAAVADWLTKIVTGSEDLTFDDEVRYLGLRFRSGAGRSIKGWLGAETRSNGASVVVSSVLRGTPAYEAGLNVGDEIIAIADRRVTPVLWSQLGEYFRAGSQQELTIARRGTLMKMAVTFGSQEPVRWRLETRPGATNAQKESLAKWLEGR